ncbi:MAG: DUF6293 family protein [Candidatus Saliniplasma sp.]
MKAKGSGVHIVTGGFEYDRILKPMLNRYPVDRLVLLRSKSSPYRDSKDLAKQFIEKLQENPIDINIHRVNIYDFDDVYSKVLKILKNQSHHNKKIYMNISSAPKLTLVAMMSAAFMMKNEADIEIFYVSPDDYLIPKIIDRLADVENNVEELRELREQFLENGTAMGLKNYEEIPIFPVKNITDRDRYILEVLKSSDGVDSIKELVLKVNRSRKKRIERSSVQYRLEKLKENGLVYTERHNKKLRISLTRVGDIYLKGDE